MAGSARGRQVQTPRWEILLHSVERANPPRLRPGNRPKPLKQGVSPSTHSRYRDCLVHCAREYVCKEEKTTRKYDGASGRSKKQGNPGPSRLVEVAPDTTSVYLTWVLVNARLICARDAHDGDSRLSTGIEHRMASAWTSRPVDAAMVVSISASSARVRKKSVVNVAAAFGPRRTSHCTSAACRTVASGLGADRRNHMMDGHGGCEGYDRRGRDGYRKRTTQAKMTGVTSKPKLQYTGNTNNLVRVSSLSSSGNGTETLRDGINQDTPRLVSSLAAALPPPPPISKSDAEFLDELGIEFVWTTEELGIDELNNLFSQVGFPRRDPTRLEAALRNTHRSLWVRASRKSRLAKEGQLLAFGRATSDGALSATIWDVAVMPAWQRGGIGRGLVERLTKSIVEEGIPVVTLYAEPGVVGLYEKLGFEVDPVGVKGMAFQSGSRRGKGLLASI